MGAVAFSISLVGCSGGASDRAFVTGTVQYRDGTPLVFAKVIASDEASGKTGAGVTDENGHYELATAKVGDGIAPGNYHVVIMEDLGDRDHRNRPKASLKYRSPATSGLEVTVKAGDRTVLDAKLDPP